MSVAARRAYARWARWYDRLARLPVVRSWRAAAADALELGATDVAVDVGAGTGANCPHLRRRVGPDGRVVALDVTRGALAVARDRTDAHVVQGDATRPPIAGPVDGVLGTFVVGMFGEPGAAVREWCDLAAPGGRVALLHFARTDRSWARLLDPAYRTFVGVGSTGETPDDATAVAVHDARVRAAHRTLAEATTDYRERRLAGGYLRLASGTVPG